MLPDFVLPDLLYPGEPIPPGYQFLLDGADDQSLDSQIHSTFPGDAIPHTQLVSVARPAAPPLLGTSGLDRVLVPNLTATDIQEVSETPSESPEAVIDPYTVWDRNGVRLSDERNEPPPASNDLVDVKFVSLQYVDVENASKIVQLTKKVENLSQEKKRLAELLKTELTFTNKSRVALFQEIEAQRQKANTMCELLNGTDTTHTEELRQWELQAWEVISAIERQNREIKMRTLDLVMNSRNHSEARAICQKLEEECSELTQELVNMDHRYNCAFQEHILNDLFCRFETGSDTILSLKSELAERKSKAQEECEELQCVLREERRKAKHQRIRDDWADAFERRELEGEEHRLSEDLIALKTGLQDAKEKLRLKDATLAVLEEQRESLLTLVTEESIIMWDLLQEGMPVGFADLQQERARLITLIEQQDRRTRDKTERTGGRFEGHNSTVRRNRPEPRPATPTPYSEPRKSVRIMEKSAISLPTTPTKLGLQTTGSSLTPSGEKRGVLLKRIRMAMNASLGIKSDAEIVVAVTQGHEFTEEEHAAREPRSAPATVIGDVCTRKLRPFWKDINCEYNRLLATVFAYDFIAKNPSHRLDQQIIVDHFLKRLRRLNGFLH